MNSVFCTTAPIKPQGHGGGSSSFYELEALKATTDVAQIIQTVGKMDGLYPNNPFMEDYRCSLEAKTADVAVFNGGPWSATMRAINAHRTIVDCPAHNLQHSMEEFERCTGSYPFINMTDPMLRDMQFYYLKNADVIITQSKMSIQWLADLGVHQERAVVIPGGCHPPKDVLPLPERFGVGYLGSLGPDKGVIYLLTAWSMSGHYDADLIIGGQQGLALLDRLSEIKASTKLTGWIDNMADYWSQISVYVQPSVTEGFGLPVLEAMSYGRPVIVTSGTGASEIITDGHDGFIIPIRNPDVIIDYVNYFMTRPEEVKRMGENARETALRYTWEHAQKEYEKVIGER